MDKVLGAAGLQMDWRKRTFDTLCELFPQIDVRIIKATALDHGDDVESAVDFLVTEVVGYDAENSDQVGQVPDASSTLSPIDILDSTCEVIGHGDSLISLESGLDEPADNNNIKHEESIVWLSELGVLSQIDSVKSSVSDSEHATMYRANDDKMALSSSFVPQNGVIQFSPELEHTEQNSSFRPNYRGENDQFISFLHAASGWEEQCSIFSSSLSLESASLLPKDGLLLASGQGLGLSTGELLQQQLGFEASREVGLSTSEESSNPLHFGQSKAPLGSGAQRLMQFEENNLSSSNGQCEEVASHSFAQVISNDDCQGDTCLESSLQPIDGITLNSDCGDGAICETVSNSSSYNFGIESLDELVQEARSEKVYLMNTVEEIRMLQLKVDQEEAAAQQAKLDAEKGGLDILMKAEEIRQALARAREANEMRAGEIYGEKAVLATEARELRSRLVQLKSEKAKSIAVLDELRAALGARLDSAAQERDAAEEEKRRKEASARKVLAMEEALMAKVTQESKDLEAEAEACTRLREFLIDHGSIVDSLQGEMAVLCEDVEILKKHIKEGTLSSSSGYFSMARFFPQHGFVTPYKLSCSNRSSAASSQELVRTMSGETQNIADGSGSLLLSPRGGRTIDAFAGSGSGFSSCRSMKSVVSRVSSRQSSYGSESVHSAFGLEHSLDGVSAPVKQTVGSANEFASNLSCSALDTVYLSSMGIDTEANSCSGQTTVLGSDPDVPVLKQGHSNEFKLGETIMDGSNPSHNGLQNQLDDDDWHMLNIQSNKNGSSRSFSVTSSGAQQMEKIVWECT